ncbi:zinc finger protein 62 homolog [Coccinella septempunctata]|uniref:zinc finger protein 62 homolog n=1 Tax=Coccinella septempunctata TaxID=41139 RepID=UPI001D07006E|nr:zinc finger protein 62 homolog [Coccinella septempunctata]
MVNTNDVKKKRPRWKPLNLCRICLTYSPSMIGMYENFRDCETMKIHEVLQKALCCEIIITQKTPNQICSVCLSILKILYDFKKQFEESQIKIFGNINEINQDNSRKTAVETSTEVEIIIGKNNFSLDDVVVVDKDERKEDYTQLLNNLGKAVTVEYLGKSSSKDNPIQEVYDEEPQNPSGDVYDLQTCNDNLKDEGDSEEYETIIIEYISDTEDAVMDQNECNESKKNGDVKISKDSSLSKIIHSYIIEGDYSKELQNEVIGESGKKECRNFSPEHINRVRQKKTKKHRSAEMMEIEKYIIYGTGQSAEERSEEMKNEFTIDNKNNLSEINRDDEKESNKDSTVQLNQDSSETNIDKLEGTGTNLHFCDKCFKCFNNKRILDRHLVFAHGQKGGAPKRCNRIKTSKEDRRINQRERWKERFKKNPMLCQICGHVSKSAGGAKYHSLTHGEKSYMCDFCPKKFFTPSHLKNHLQFKHERKTIKHLCSICGEHKNSSTALAYHMKLHTNNPKRYPCPVCGLSFLVKGGLKMHLRRHMGDRRYPCNICNKSFFSANERKKHVMIHTGERPHNCKYCDRKFVSAFNQKIHMMTHSGPYLCELCFRGFADKDLLKMHIKYKHNSENGNEKKLPSKNPIQPTKEDTEIIDDAMEPLQCPESSDNMILEVFNLLDGTEEDELKYDDVD